jgi:two-component system response regulator FixJ
VAKDIRKNTDDMPVVYVVDDDEMVRKSLYRVFRSAGFEVHCFGSALEFLENYRPCGDACLILDLRMPGIGGLELQERLAQLGISIPIILYTGNADVPVAVRAMKAGAFNVIEKPFSDDLLIEQVRLAIAQERSRRRRSAPVLAARQALAALTDREREVAELLADGLSARQIGERLAISPRTVETHRERILDKARVGSTEELAKLLAVADLFDETPDSP